MFPLSFWLVFIFSTIKKDTTEGKKCHIETMMSRKPDRALLFVFFFFEVSFFQSFIYFSSKIFKQISSPIMSLNLLHLLRIFLEVLEEREEEGEEEEEESDVVRELLSKHSAWLGRKNPVLSFGCGLQSLRRSWTRGLKISSRTERLQVTWRGQT